MEPEDFQRPTGRLDADWVDEDTLEALITQAAALTDNTNAQKAYVYAAAYSMLADDYATKAASRKADDIAEAFTAGQLAHWARQAREWQAALDSILGASNPKSGHRSVTPTW